MGQVELDAAIRPLLPVHAEVGPLQRSGGISLIRETAHEERRVAKKHQPATRSEQSGCFRYPHVWVAPDGRSVLADGEVEGCVGIGDGFGVAMDDLEVKPMLLLEPPGGAGNGSGRRRIGWLLRHSPAVAENCLPVQVDNLQFREGEGDVLQQVQPTKRPFVRRFGIADVLYAAHHGRLGKYR
jgi:hypothetical protein